MHSLLQHGLAILFLVTIICVWVLFQRYVARTEPEIKSIEQRRSCRAKPDCESGGCSDCRQQCDTATS